jgi:metal-responsive CopG/Arc/MetJ family transcriptional regulator
MSMKRLNITLPDRVAEALVNYSNKSKFIAEAVIQKIEKDNKEKLDKLLIEGYKAESKNDEKINKEWENATFERWDD